MGLLQLQGLPFEGQPLVRVGLLRRRRDSGKRHGGGEQNDRGAAHSWYPLHTKLSLSAATRVPFRVSVEVVEVGRSRLPVVWLWATQTGAVVQAWAKVSVHLEPLVELPTVTSPTLSLPATVGEVPQSVAPAVGVGAVPFSTKCFFEVSPCTS